MRRGELHPRRGVSPSMGRAAASFMYPSSSVGLVACPFCREMFQKGEAEKCPVCGVELAPFEKIVPSAEAVDDDDDGAPKSPEYEKLPWTYLKRSKGVLLALAVIGLALFFAPWIHLTLPHVETYTGFDVARKFGWTWGAGVAWFVLIPTVLSRRSIVQMRGARVAAGFLTFIPGLTAAILLLRPPHGANRIPVQFAWEWPIWA